MRHENRDGSSHHDLEQLPIPELRERAVVAVDRTLDRLEEFINKDREDPKFGSVSGFEYFRHGAGHGWCTVTVGRGLMEVATSNNSLLEKSRQKAEDLLVDYIYPGLMGLRVSDADSYVGWGWGYEETGVPPDPDDTAQALEVLRGSEEILIRRGVTTKEELEDVYRESERLMLSRQNEDGGFGAYRKKDVEGMGYPGRGWVESHPEITAAVSNQIVYDTEAKERAEAYLQEVYETNGYMPSYWLATPHYGYMLWEGQDTPHPTEPVEAMDIGFFLRAEAKRGRAHPELLQKLISMQLPDGSFPPTTLHRLPRPNMMPDDVINGRIESIDIRKEIGRRRTDPEDAPLLGRSNLGTGNSLAGLVAGLDALDFQDETREVSSKSTFEGLEELRERYPDILNPKYFPEMAYTADQFLAPLDVDRRVTAAKVALSVFVIDDLVDERKYPANEVIQRMDRYKQIVSGAEVESSDDQLSHFLSEIRRDVEKNASFGELEDYWVETFGKMVDSMALESRVGSTSSKIPSYDEHMRTAMDSIGVPHYLTTGLILFNDPRIADRLASLKPAIERSAVAIRLANDLRSAKREREEGTINSIVVVAQELKQADWYLTDETAVEKSIGLIIDRKETAGHEALALLEALDTGEEEPEQGIARVVNLVIAHYRDRDYGARESQ